MPVDVAIPARLRHPLEVLLFAILLLSASGVAACGKADPDTPGGTAPASASSAAASASPTSSPTQPVLEDGRHAVYLTHLDVSHRMLTFDLVRFLTGAEAKAAWAKDHPEEPDGPPNDYYIVNDNPKLRTLPVAPGVDVKVVDLSGSGGVGLVPIAFADLPGYLSRDPIKTDKYLWPAPFWLTVAHEEILGLDEQFIP